MDRYRSRRQKMVDSQLRSRGIRNNDVLRLMEKIPRHLFIDEGLLDRAYSDGPLPIGERQTISQPYMVALMTEALQLGGNEKVLEIGTGSGYQTAILAELSDRVLSIERFASLAAKAKKILESLNYYNVLIRVGDGTYGWVEEAPFNAIIVTAGSPDLPEPLKKQLAPGGRLVIPVGDRNVQTLLRVTRMSADPDDIRTEDLGGCRFVDLVGEYGWKG